MGLDQFAYCTKEDIGAVDFGEPEDAELIHHWRKHPNLHGWMDARYHERGGEHGSFLDNSLNTPGVLRLTEDDLDDLEHAVRNDGLPFTEGFFFGESKPEDMPGDLEFVQAARARLADGFAVYYSAWW